MLDRTCAIPWIIVLGTAVLASARVIPPVHVNVLDIGSRLELFVDDWLIERMTGGVSLKLHTPRPAEIVLRFDKPWEGRWSEYVRVLRDDDRYRMYYRAGLEEKPPSKINDPESVCYAESTDGIRWTKPELGLFAFKGSKKTNIVWKGIRRSWAEGVASHCGFGVFKDTNPNCKPQERYKVLSSGGYRRPVYAFVSPDAIHWRLIQDKPVIDEHQGAVAAYDSHILTWWDPGTKRYVTYHRIWYRPVEPKVRSVAMRTSEDFIHWTPLRRLNFGNTPVEHIYTSGIGPYFRAPHILLGFPRRFWPERKRLPGDELLKGISDVCFLSSRNGVNFDRRFMESFIRPGRDRLNWLSRSNTVAAGMIQTAPDEISLYVSHRWGHPSQYVRRHVIRTDGFASAHATYETGRLLTKPIVFTGKQLVINYATSAAGSIRVEIQDADGRAWGRPVPGFTLAECPEIYGDEIEQVVSWKKGSDVGSLSGKPVRLLFVMKDADLYSLRFSAK